MALHGSISWVNENCKASCCWRRIPSRCLCVVTVLITAITTLKTAAASDWNLWLISHRFSSRLLWQTLLKWPTLVTMSSPNCSITIFNVYQSKLHAQVPTFYPIKDLFTCINIVPFHSIWKFKKLAKFFAFKYCSFGVGYDLNEWYILKKPRLRKNYILYAV